MMGIVMVKRLMSMLCAVVVSAGVAMADKAPDFKLVSTDAKTVTLSQFKGKVVFLDFWATWCPPCRRSIPAVEAMYEEYSKDPRIVIMGVNVEKDPDTTLAFVKKNGMQYTVLNDDGSASEAYRVTGIPAFFVIGADGTVTKHFVGFEPDMQKDWKAEIDLQLKAVGNPVKKSKK
jgi:peroxiredoxin